mmetsp:Transcript_3033/g.10926  ORF Transcript_3033/g.10926 Transcript_3033/m.10926 type:complete len:246 (-) Transcript_3033:950-1687(-)
MLAASLQLSAVTARGARVSHKRSRLLRAVPCPSTQRNLPVTASATKSDPPDPAIKCPFYRLNLPSQDNFVQFVKDMDAGGLDVPLTIAFGVPFVILQQGLLKFITKFPGPNWYEFDGIIPHVLSHEDLCLPHLPEVQKFIRDKKDADGTISLRDLYDMKVYVSKTFYNMQVTFASETEIYLIFLRCGGDVETGRVDAEDCLLLLEGYEPKNSGKVTYGAIKKIEEFRDWEPASVWKSLTTDMKLP